MMNRYLWIVCPVMFALLVGLPCHVQAASITETKAAIGQRCVASAENSTAMGYKTTASGFGSTAMGTLAAASGYASTAMGDSTKAIGEGSRALGYYANAAGSYSTAMGRYTTVSGSVSTVIGNGYSTDHTLENTIGNSFMVGYMADSDDTTPEFFVKDGGVGINTTSPQTTFHVQRSVSAYADLANHVAAIENTNLYGTSPDVLMLKVNNTNQPGTACSFITFTAKDAIVGEIQGNGNGGIQFLSSGGDFAEYLPKADPNETLTPGDIVGLSPKGISKRTDHAQRIMVVTTAPAVLGSQPKEKDEPRYAPVAFLGQVPVRVEGAVRSGDYIIPSGRGDGIGRAVSSAELTPEQYGHVVGRAVQTCSEKGIKTLTTLVGLPQNGL